MLMKWYQMHIHTTPLAPATLSCTKGWLATPSTPLSCGMAGCRQINSILANSGRENSIQILYQ